MLFSEIYSAYYNTVASIISCSQQGKLDLHTPAEILDGHADAETDGDIEQGHVQSENIEKDVQNDYGCRRAGYACQQSLGETLLAR